MRVRDAETVMALGDLLRAAERDAQRTGRNDIGRCGGRPDPGRNRKRHRRDIPGFAIGGPGDLLRLSARGGDKVAQAAALRLCLSGSLRPTRRVRKREWCLRLAESGRESLQVCYPILDVGQRHGKLELPVQFHSGWLVVERILDGGHIRKSRRSERGVLQRGRQVIEGRSERRLNGDIEDGPIGWNILAQRRSHRNRRGGASGLAEPRGGYREYQWKQVLEHIIGPCRIVLPGCTRWAGWDKWGRRP